jgi:uncharacterized protein YecE (DUF72 family)
MQQASQIYVGCAGWTIPKELDKEFPDEGSHLQRYATRFPAVEINSSFYRLHKPSTYARWADSVPSSFRFAVKLPRTITHVARLSDPTQLGEFLAGVQALGSKLGPLLVQLPPSMPYSLPVVAAFLTALRQRFDALVACEPRHPSWFSAQVDSVLADYQVARVAADPAPIPEGTEPGGWPGLIYYRLHGSPKKYYSAYSEDYVEALARRLAAASSLALTWCIFDNTARGAATQNALAVLSQLR